MHNITSDFVKKYIWTMYSKKCALKMEKCCKNQGVCIIVLSRTQFVGSEFGIFEGFGRVHSSVLVGELGFGRVRSSVFPDLGQGSAHF